MVAASFCSASRHTSQHHPNKASPLTTPSTQPGSDTNAVMGAIGGSEYAITYRRGTGVVSGSTENQRTSSALDLEGFKSTNDELLQAKCTGDSAKMSRRAAMHITGPTLVTVPLHITNTLAFGVLQGEGSERIIQCGRDKDKKSNLPDKEKVEEIKIKKGEGEKNHKDVLMDRMEDTETCGRTEGESEEKKEKPQEKKEDCGYKSEMVMANGSREQPRILTSDSEEAKVITDDTEDYDGANEYMGNCIYLFTTPLPPQTCTTTYACIYLCIHQCMHSYCLHSLVKNYSSLTAKTGTIACHAFLFSL